jgi:hypothetical protein
MMKIVSIMTAKMMVTSKEESEEDCLLTKSVICFGGSLTQLSLNEFMKNFELSPQNFKGLETVSTDFLQKFDNNSVSHRTLVEFLQEACLSQSFLLFDEKLHS